MGICALDAGVVDVVNRNDALQEARFPTLNDLDDAETRRAAGRGMRITAERIRTTEGDKDTIPGRRPIGEIGSQSRGSAFVEINGVDVRTRLCIKDLRDVLNTIEHPDEAVVFITTAP